MSDTGVILEVREDETIRRHQIANRLTDVERRLLTYLAKHQTLIACVGNIGAGKSSLVKLLAYSTGMNALFELPDEGFEDHIAQNQSVFPLLATAKNSAKRTLGRYYGAINEFIACQARERSGSAAWAAAQRNLESAALDIQHAYLDLRKMQLQAVPHLSSSTCIDGSPFADRYAFCEVLHRDMDVPYLTAEALQVIDARLESEFRPLVRPGLLVLLKSPVECLLRNIRDRRRDEEQSHADEVPEGLSRLVRALNRRYDEFVGHLRQSGWYTGPVLVIDVSRIDFVSNVRHLIAVYDGIETLLVPKEFRA
ncbi:MAG TPA: deoxynucleoside kinase [Candidatus Saccharimonadales bacterium]|nr:deoxynucleoside kinase [Candidatus Saccharimonadales bacterium]